MLCCDRYFGDLKRAGRNKLFTDLTKLLMF